jgi:hypothetical protein
MDQISSASLRRPTFPTFMVGTRSVMLPVLKVDDEKLKLLADDLLFLYAKLYDKFSRAIIIIHLPKKKQP